MHCPCRQVLPVCILLGMLVRVAVAHPGNHDQEDAQPAANFLYDTADQVVDATVLENPLRYDADAAVAGEAVWYAWLEFTPGKGDALWIGRRENGQWIVKNKVDGHSESYARPTLTRAGGGRLWLSYEAEQNEQWDVFAVALNDEGTSGGSTQCVSNGTSGADIQHCTATGEDGGLWVVWQSDASGQFDIVGRHFDGDAWNGIVTISNSPRGDWHPQSAVDSRGNLFVVWDGYDGESYNVYLRSRQNKQWGEVTAIAATSAFEGRADLAIDKQDRVWLTWEEGGENWGQPFRGILTPKVGDQLGPLHRFRRLHVAVVDESGVSSLKSPLPQPSLAAAARRATSEKAVKHTGAFYERGRLCVDGSGRVWLAYRHFYAPWLGYQHKSHVEQGWGVYARCYGADGWSDLYRFDVDQGDGLQRLELAPAGKGVTAVWTTGRTDRRRNRRPRGIVVASVESDQAPPAKLASSLSQPPAASKGDGEAISPERPTEEVDGKSYTLFFGDLHRHTDLSLCRVPIDGTIDDAYRYAADVAQLDFLGITDHSRDIALGNALSQLWWRSRKEVYRHQLGTAFFPFYAYERSHGNTADHNVVSLRGDMLRRHTYPVPKFWEELDENTFTIPHQPIRRDTWNYQNDLLRPLMEIYQGCRDASIEDHAHTGLDKGYLLGFIASSDHMSTSASYACVWAEKPDRESIFFALKARRTYGATARIQLVARAGNHWMGQEIPAANLPPLVLKARGTAPIRSVKLLVDGKVEKVFSPNAREVELKVPLAVAGDHYVYFHLLQADGNEAWSSPFFLRRKIEE